MKCKRNWRWLTNIFAVVFGFALTLNCGDDNKGSLESLTGFWELSIFGEAELAIFKVIGDKVYLEPGEEGCSIQGNSSNFTIQCIAEEEFEVDCRATEEITITGSIKGNSISGSVKGKSGCEGSQCVEVWCENESWSGPFSGIRFVPEDSNFKASGNLGELSFNINTIQIISDSFCEEIIGIYNEGLFSFEIYTFDWTVDVGTYEVSNLKPIYFRISGSGVLINYYASGGTVEITSTSPFTGSFNLTDWVDFSTESLISGSLSGNFDIKEQYSPQ